MRTNAAIHVPFAKMFEIAMNMKDLRPVVQKKAKIGMIARKSIATFKSNDYSEFGIGQRGARLTMVNIGIAKTYGFPNVF